MPTVSFTTSGALRKSALRQANERLVLDAIRRAPGISRNEIARITGFPLTSVAFVVKRLIERNLVKQHKPGKSAAQAGRPATGLRLSQRSLMAVGVEIARPRSEVVLVDYTGEIVQRRSVPWLADPIRFLHRVAAAVHEVTAGHKPREILGVGVSLPGTIDKGKGLVIGAEALGWFDVAAGDVLRSQLRWPVLFENDANLSALAEQWHTLAGSDALRYFVYVRTQGGLGTGVVVDGRILHGVASSGAEFGHVMLFPDGRSCRCGNRGCWEQYASDAALVSAYREFGGTPETGESPKDAATMIVDRARKGDAAALRALETTSTYLALGFVNLIAALNPQAIILGEPFRFAWDLIETRIVAEVSKRIPPYCLAVLKIVPGKIGADSALRGAAALVLAHFFTRFDHTKDDSLPKGLSMVAQG